MTFLPSLCWALHYSTSLTAPLLADTLHSTRKQSQQSNSGEKSSLETYNVAIIAIRTHRRKIRRFLMFWMVFHVYSALLNIPFFPLKIFSPLIARLVYRRGYETLADLQTEHSQMRNRFRKWKRFYIKVSAEKIENGLWIVPSIIFRLNSPPFSFYSNVLYGAHWRAEKLCFYIQGQRRTKRKMGP